MKIGENRPASRSSTTTSIGPMGTRTTSSAAPEPKPVTAVDQMTLAGLSEADLTPRVKAAIMSLMVEVDKLRREVEQKNARIAHLEQLADQDPMLPALNRRAFVRELTRAAGLADRYGAPASIIYIDVNNFKTINDTHGHAMGDAVLLHIGELLAARVRGSDVVGRLGGDEFGVLLLNCPHGTAVQKAAQLTEAIHGTPLLYDGQVIRLSVAHGVHTINGDEDIVEALHRADQAMYMNKRKMPEAVGDASPPGG